MGQQAFRFGLAQGDLSTVNGRRKLFQSIACHRPIHLWYSPVCGPWSSWSALNASRSAETQWEYQQKRSELRYQIALGNCSLPISGVQGTSFQLGTASKSLMLLHPGINEIHQHTQVSQFDMCEAGDLRDPMSKLHMKKGMQVVTTHEPIYRALHGLTCRKNHPHQQLEGSTHVHGHSILRTKFSEIYPRKFVRLVAKTMCNNTHRWPFNWKVGCGLNRQDHSDGTPVLAAGHRRTVLKPQKSQGRNNFARSQLSAPEETDETGVKRRRLDGKQGPVPNMKECQAMFQDIQKILPRVW